MSPKSHPPWFLVSVTIARRRFEASALAPPRPIVMASVDATLAYANQLKGLLAKADGKDKFIALVQYVAMFTSAGQPGVALSVQKSLGAARKPFRVFKPVEFLMPLLEKPPKGRGVATALAYVRPRAILRSRTRRGVARQKSNNAPTKAHPPRAFLSPSPAQLRTLHPFPDPSPRLTVVLMHL